MMSNLYHKILVPLDGSALAEQVLPHLQRLAAPTETTLVLVNVITPMPYTMTPMTSIGYVPPDFFTYPRSTAEAYIVEQQQQLQALGFRVETHIVEGDVAANIVRVAAETHVDLIAMTTHGRAGFVRWALGSVAEQVVCETPLPVFLVRETTTLSSDKFHRILVPLDGSPLAEQALPEAVALAQATGAELLLLQVIQTLDEENERILFKNKAEAQASFVQWQTSAETYLQQVAQPIQTQGVVCVCRAVAGNVVETIINTAETAGIDLLVISTHGRSGLGHWFYGSVTNKVLRGVSCPLLVIHNLPASADLPQQGI
jgi:nucleotide-binding universal stress UspA family protein